MFATRRDYSMSANPTKTPDTTTDDAVPVLGADGAAAKVNATVLFRLDTHRATGVYRMLQSAVDSKVASQQKAEQQQRTSIQALAQLVNAPGSSTIALPFDQHLTPLVNVPSK
jgi:hypothetical protein